MFFFIKGVFWKLMIGVVYINWLKVNIYKFFWIIEFLVLLMRK